MFFRSFSISSLVVLSFLISDLAMALPRDTGHVQDVCAYHETRVAYLLGCCGDTEIEYSGPKFPVFNKTNARMSAALNEVEVGLKQCEDHSTPEYVSLLLDQIGTEVELAATLLEMHGSAQLDSAVLHSEKATKELRTILTLHPKTAVHLWPWITQSFLRAGRPIDALLFLSSLSATCCDNAGLSRIRGDVFLILKNEPQAAVEYSSWLSSDQDHCGSQSSLLNVSYLKSKGFDLPEIATSLNSNNAICISLNEWHPYVRLSARYIK